MRRSEAQNVTVPRDPSDPRDPEGPEGPEDRSGPGKRVRSVRVARTSVPARGEDDVVAVEEPLEIRLNERPLAVTFRTPGDDEELVLGFLTSELIVDSLQDVEEICVEPSRVHVQLSEPALDRWARRRVERELRVTSACGACGRPSLEDVDRPLPTLRPETPPAQLLRSLPERLRARQSLFAATGGSHAAGLYRFDGEEVCVFEDIGRHNAVDKVVGWCVARDLLPGAGCVLAVSGRAGFELVEKAIVAGIPALAAVGATTSAAAQLALDRGLGLFVFVSKSGVTQVHALGATTPGATG